jgi:hypothetical protein
LRKVILLAAMLAMVLATAAPAFAQTVVSGPVAASASAGLPVACASTAHVAAAAPLPRQEEIAQRVSPFLPPEGIPPAGIGTVVCKHCKCCQ